MEELKDLILITAIIIANGTLFLYMLVLMGMISLS